ncbi:MAG: MBL fold metallo-hydrolase [Actinomycetota bacterium]
MEISFHGAARGVTGSCHLVQAAGHPILLDCGMYQGGRRLDEENADDFGFDPSDVEFLLLTHAHLDHCGRVPLLVKRGFRGRIVTTAATRELARIVMLDAAHLHEEEARRDARHAARGGREETTPPLYTVDDALHASDHFDKTTGYGDPMTLAPGIDVTFLDAGHILGSASLLLDVRDGGAHHVVGFSGDIGNADRPLLRAPTPTRGADAVVMETTYGNRHHGPQQAAVDQLYSVVATTIQRGGNVVIPTFALERAQEVLFHLRRGIETGRLPRAMRVYLDSPMAISATAIFERHPEGYDDDVAALFRGGGDPFALPGLRFTRETSESKALNDIGGGAVIMAGSGMATGGRVRHHLRHNLWRPEASVLLVGYAAEGTLARLLQDGVKRVTLFGEEIQVKAEIHSIDGFSAHADADELLAWHRAIGPERTFLVHGEQGAMDEFATHLEKTQVVMPRLGESFTL